MQLAGNPIFTPISSAAGSHATMSVVIMLMRHYGAIGSGLDVIVDTCAREQITLMRCHCVAEKEI